MDDYINRQAAIDLVRDVCDAVMSGCESWYDPETEDEVYKDIREVDAILKCNKEVRIALRNMPSAQPEQRWIPCSERLPTKKTEVIYTLDNHYVSTGYMTDRDYNGDEMELHWEDMESGALIYPEAWMPLPEPYKGYDK